MGSLVHSPADSWHFVANLDVDPPAPVKCPLLERHGWVTATSAEPCPKCRFVIAILSHKLEMVCYVAIDNQNKDQTVCVIALGQCFILVDWCSVTPIGLPRSFTYLGGL